MASFPTTGSRAQTTALDPLRKVCFLLYASWPIVLTSSITSNPEDYDFPPKPNHALPTPDSWLPLETDQPIDWSHVFAELNR